MEGMKRKERGKGKDKGKNKDKGKETKRMNVRLDTKLKNASVTNSPSRNCMTWKLS